MSLKLEREVADFTVWFLQNKDRIPSENLKLRCNFYERAIHCLLDIFLLSVRDLRVLEGRGGAKTLLLPDGSYRVIPEIEPYMPKKKDWRPDVYAK